MWVCLRIAKNITYKGKIHRFEPGDWVSVGRQTAQKWIEQRHAYSTDDIVQAIPHDSAGLVIRDKDAIQHALVSEVVTQLGLESHITDDWSRLPYAESAVWHPSAGLRPNFVAVGFMLLKRWHIAVPLSRNGVLACNDGVPDERERTTALIGDGRVPLRDTRLIFVRRCAETRALWDQWHSELAGGADERHAFLRAVWTHKPLICDLPPSWV